MFRIERDALLLANRIALLKQEQTRTCKKIEETTKRTHELLEMKKRNEQRLQQVIKLVKFRNVKSNKCLLLSSSSKISQITCYSKKELKIERKFNKLCTVTRLKM
jgi:hypothetical protein